MSSWRSCVWRGRGRRGLKARQPVPRASLPEAPSAVRAAATDCGARPHLKHRALIDQECTERSLLESPLREEYWEPARIRDRGVTQYVPLSLSVKRTAVVCVNLRQPMPKLAERLPIESRIPYRRSVRARVTGYRRHTPRSLNATDLADHVMSRLRTAPSGCFEYGQPVCTITPLVGSNGYSLRFSNP